MYESGGNLLQRGEMRFKVLERFPTGHGQLDISL